MKLLKMIFGVVLGTVLFLLIFLFSPTSESASDVLEGYQATKQFSTDKESIDGYIKQMKDATVKDSPTFGVNGALSEEQFKELNIIITTLAERQPPIPYEMKALDTPYSVPPDQIIDFCCASFVSYAYFQAGLIPESYCIASVSGLSLGISARNQEGISYEIAEEDLMPGDIIYYDNTYDPPQEWSHVAIYLGDGKRAHSGSPMQITDWKQGGEFIREYGRLKDFSAEIAAEKGATQ